MTITGEKLDRIISVRDGLRDRMNTELESAELAITEERYEDARQHVTTFDNLSMRYQTNVIMELAIL